jgi:UDP-N-acetylmuramoyl-tripeptide--D-alanyl-D-alanine ligase
MRLQASELARAVDGSLVGPDAQIDGATIDSRQSAGGRLFVPVRARRDGHDFIEDALAAGAAAYLTAAPPRGGTAIVVDDTMAALTSAGGAARDRLPDIVVGITGSVGKTSTKDLLAAVLSRRWRTAASARSFNNELGVPLTLLNAPDDSEAVVVEMGARGVGHVAALCAVARPTIAVVTTVGKAHTEQFGTLEQVAQSKGELVESLPADGVAVLNAEVELVAAMAARAPGMVLTFGTASGDVRAGGVTLDAELRPRFRLLSPWGEADVRLGVRGEHQVANALAAAAAALACGMGPEEVVVGLESAELSPWRMELARTPEGALVLNDAYNANPVSTAAALRSLARLDAVRRTAVLGVMAELGPDGPEEHRRIGALAAGLGIRLVAVAAPDYGSEQVDDVDAAVAALGPLGEGDAVLVKGSRTAGLERLAERLLAGRQDERR